MKFLKDFAIGLIGAISIIAILVAYNFFVNRDFFIDDDVYLKPKITLSENIPIGSYHVTQEEVERIKNSVEYLKKDPRLTLDAQKVLSNIPKYIRLIEKNYSEIRGMKIDFIAQLHLDSAIFYDFHFSHAVVMSQKRVGRLVRSDKYQVVGCEASWEVPMTFFDYVKTVEGPYDASVDDIMHRLDKIDWRASFLGIYAQVHKKPIPIGIEDSDFYKLRSNIIYFSAEDEEVTTEQIEKYNDITFNVFNPLASKIALAKMLEFMKLHELHFAALPMGYAHIPDFITLAKSIGLESSFIQTVPHEFINKEYVF